MKIAAEDYGPLKAFFGWMCTNAIDVSPDLPPESRPISVLNAIEKMSPAKARQGLGLAIGDIVEDFADASLDLITRLDQALRQEGLPTLSEVRARFWHKVRAILKRERVRNEGEYYALRNVVDALEDKEAAKAWAMLAAFEGRLVKDK